MPAPASAATARAASGARAAARACSPISSCPGPSPRKSEDDAPAAIAPIPDVGGNLVGIDRTAKLYIGGKQARPDGGYSYPVAHPKTAARRAGRARQPQGHPQRRRGGPQGRKLGRPTGHNRAQVLYYLAENLAARAAEFADRLQSFGDNAANAKEGVQTSIQRSFWYAAQADKFDGVVHSTQSSFVTLAMHEPSA